MKLPAAIPTIFGGDMFSAHEFADVKKANEHIKKILAELDTPKSLEFQIIHSLSETECTENGGSWEDIGDIMMNFLLDLDAMQGFVVHDDLYSSCWDYVECEERYDDKPIVYKPEDEDEIYVQANEGVVVLHNQFAVCENEFPIIVLKKSFWEYKQDSIIEMLKEYDPTHDYTSKISPAIYVELFYQDSQYTFSWIG